MELKFTEGCTCFSLEVDEKDFNDFSLKEKREILHKIIDNSDEQTLKEILMKYIQLEYDNYESDGPCDCCGDWIDTYHKVIPESIALWLDDERDPFKGNYKVNYDLDKYSKVVWVKSYSEFVFWINTNGLPDLICFDNDLGEEKEGYDAAKWLVEYCQENNFGIPKYKIQSANPVAVKNIQSYLENYKKVSNDFSKTVI